MGPTPSVSQSMNKLLINSALLIVAPPVGLYLVVFDNQTPIPVKVIISCIGLPLGVVLYAVLYLLVRGALA